jgi:site-specific DNA-methyltransferase (adenine-specific)
MRTLELYNGNCLTELQKIADNSIDSVVTDPPYELGFMGKAWDASGIAFNVNVWKECLRVLKPGGHILAFGGTRTYHRMTVAIEDAGFEIRDCIAWMYGSGFPKSHNIGKAVDKLQGNANESKVYHNEGDNRSVKNSGNGNSPICKKCHTASWIVDKKYCKAEDGICINPERYDANNDWEGWGTALKPAFEPVVMGRKPIEGTVANNVLTHGVGGLNIDASRIAHNEPIKIMKAQEGGNKVYGQSGRYEDTTELKAEGRFPANIILDEEAGKVLDEQSGKLNKQGKCKTDNKSGWQNEYVGGTDVNTVERKLYLDEGGASRFFYCPKASKKDRDEGLNIKPQSIKGRDEGQDKTSIAYKARPTERQNIHPTVKPTQLMEYLIKLVTPKGGKVLDPFMGSGSTGKGAVLNDYSFIGIELSPEYFEIAESRINAVKDKTKFWC